MANDNYLLPKDVNAVATNQHKNSLKCLHLNVRSLYSKEAELDCFISSFSFLFDVVMLTETWCKDDQDNFQFHVINPSA